MEHAISPSRTNICFTGIPALLSCEMDLRQTGRKADGLSPERSNPHDLACTKRDKRLRTVRWVFEKGLTPVITSVTPSIVWEMYY